MTKKRENYDPQTTKLKAVRACISMYNEDLDDVDVFGEELAQVRAVIKKLKSLEKRHMHKT